MSAEYFLVRRLCEQMNNAKMGRLTRFFEVDGVKKAFDLTEQRFRQWLLVKPDFFVLDELGGRERTSDAHYEAVLDVLECRKHRPFMAISNLTPAELEKVYDGRIVSRLGSGTVCELNGEDRRLS